MPGTVTFVHQDSGQVRTITATCTADDAAATFPATALPSFEGRIVSFRSNPGATAPTDNYDVTLVDGDGVDRLQGVGANRDTANSEDALVVYATTSTNPVVELNDTLTLTIENNAVNSAVIVATLTYLPA